MFKKLKDKITEEVKQSPLKSVQQLASAVVSPSSSSVFEPSSNDHFCIDDNDDDNQGVVQNPSAKPASGGFTTVSLLGQVSSPVPVLPPPPPPPSHSRRSSISSVTSDSTSLFPRYEPSSVHFHLQSDLESASEMEDSALSLQLERVSKENLYEAYRKLRTRYSKYKGRFVDLVEHYRRLEKENVKCKNVLSETQDKALRRISELREQCSLEQEAKAHLEEALRSDLEEKDHLIATLNTKIELLKSGNKLDGFQDVTTEALTNPEELTALQEEVKKFKELLIKCKTSITEKNEVIERQLKEIDSIKILNNEKLTAVTVDLNAARNEVQSLKNTIETLKKNEEEAALSLAENKLSVHQELEKRDEQIKKLKSNIEGLNKEKDNLYCKVNVLEDELKAACDFGKEWTSDDEKADFIQELSRGKSEAVKLMQQKLILVEQNLNEKLKTKENEVGKISKENDVLKQNVKQLEEQLSLWESKMANFNSDASKGSGDIINDLSHLNCNNNVCRSRLEKEISGKCILESQVLDKEKEIDCLRTEHKLSLNEKESKIKELSTVVDDLKMKNNNLLQQFSSGSSENEVLKKEIISHKEAVKNLSAEKERLIQTVEQQNEKLNEINSEVLHWKDALSSKSEDLLKSSAENEHLKDISDNLKEKFSDEMKRILDSKESEITGIKTSFEKEICEKNGKVDNLEVIYNDLKVKFDEQQHIINQIKNELKSIQEKEDSLQKELIEKDAEVDSLKSFVEKEKQYCQNLIKEAEDKSLVLNSVIATKDKLLLEKEINFNELQTKLENCKEEIKILKNKIDERKAQVNNQLEPCVLKNKFFENLFMNVKTLICSSNDCEVKLLNDNDYSSEITHDLQKDGNYILSVICDMKNLIANKEDELRKVSSDLEKTLETSRKINSKHIHLESLYQKQSLRNKELMESLSSQLESLKNVKIQQKDLNGFVNKLLSEFLNNINSIKIEANKLNTYCLLEKEMNCINEEKNAEFEKYKDAINKLKIQLKDKENKLKEESDIKNKLKLAEEEKRCYEEEKVYLNSKISDLQNEISALKETCDQLKVKLEDKNIRCLQIETDLETNLKRLNDELAKYESLKSELLFKEKDHKIALEAKDRELSSVIDELLIKDNKFDEAIGKRDKEIENLTIRLKNAEKIQNELSQSKQAEVLLAQEESDALRKELSDQIHLKNNKIMEFENLVDSKGKEINELKISIEKFTTLNQSLEYESKLLKEEVSQLKYELAVLKDLNETKENRVRELEVECDDLKNKLKTLSLKYDDEIKFVKENFNLKLFEENMRIRNESLTEIESLKMSLSLAEIKNHELRSNFNESELKVQELEKSVNELQIREKDLCEKIESLTDKLQNFTASGEKCDSLKSESEDELKGIKKENELLKLKLDNLEEKHVEKIKELVSDFNLKLLEKDEEITSLESGNFDKRQAEEDFIAMEIKHQIKDLQHELVTRGDAFEKLMEEHKEEKKKRETAIAELTKSHDLVLRDHDKKWRACLDRRLAETEAKYKEEIEELSKEWNSERKSEISNTQGTEDDKKELECSNRLAVAAMESGVNSAELLRKQVTALSHQLDEEKRQHKREVSELQRLLVLKKHSTRKSKTQDLSVDDCTEMEYLRNILYEYMMGKEPLILAKVLSAIVKFDAEQTNKVLQKEEQKISLLGQLGIS